MKKRKQRPEQIIQLLCQAEVLLGQGESIEAVCRSLGIGQSSYYKWRKSYGGMNLDQDKHTNTQLNQAIDHQGYSAAADKFSLLTDFLLKLKISL